MKADDLLELAARNLRESVLRNSLTTLGIGVGVASLVAMLSLGIGLQQVANRRLAKSGLFDSIVVTSSGSFRGFNRIANRNGPSSAGSRPLDENARAEIARLPGVLEATPDIRFMAEINYQGNRHITLVAGLPPSSRDKDPFENMQGRFYSSPEAAEAILQNQLAGELLGTGSGDSGSKLNDSTNSLIGREVTLSYAERVPSSPSTPPESTSANKQGQAHAQPSPAGDANPLMDMAGFSVMPRQTKLRIVGITEQDPEGIRGPSGARLFVPVQLVENLHVMPSSGIREGEPSLLARPAYASVSVRVKGPAQVKQVESAIKKLGFNTFSILDATRSLQRFFAVLDLFLGVFGSLALAVAALGIVNTLVMAILERRREIGIMKAIGASEGDVKKLFFAEAAVMGLFGGIVGVTLGWLIGRVINLGTNLYLSRQNLPPETLWTVPWWLVAGAILFSVGVSMISGLYPAARAARLDPIEALRYE